MLTQKRIRQIAIIMVIKISNWEADRTEPLNENDHVSSIATTFGITKEEASRLFSLYIYLNRTKLMQGFDDKENVTFSDLKEKEKDEELLGEISIKLLERKIFTDGMGVTPKIAKKLIARSSKQAEISMLEAAQFEQYMFDYFYKSVTNEITNVIIFETGKEIETNSDKFK